VQNKKTSQEMSFIKTTFRSFSKDKSFTFINVLGLTLGIFSALMIILMAKHDLSFDRFHENANSIYRVNFETSRGGSLRHHPTSPAPVTNAMKEEFTEVLDGAFVSYQRSGEFLVDGTKEFREEDGVAITTASFFDLFSFPIIAGDVASFDQPNQVILTESIARKYYGIDDPIDAVGQTLQMDDVVLNVAAIAADFPTTTDLPFTILISLETMKDELRAEVWGSIDMSTNNYVTVAPGTDIDDLESKLPAMLTKFAGDRMANFLTLKLQPLSTVHFDSRYGNYSGRTVPDRIVWGLALVALVMLITACINFINLSTANAIRRSKEVGIRKVLGVGRMELIQKFIGETAILTLISFLIAIPIAKILHPTIEEMVGFTFDFVLFGDSTFWLFSAAVAVIIILFAGLYPAFFMSRFDPMNALRSGSSGSQSSGSWLRKSLVVFQFMISQVLLIGLFIVQSQLSYFLQADMGFDKEGVVIAQLPEGDEAKAAPLKDAWQAIPGVNTVSRANAGAASQGRWMTSFMFEGMDPDDQPFTEMKMADADYLETYGFELLAGRNYFASDSSREILVNEMLINKMGITNPEDAIGKTISASQEGGERIVGVIKDFFATSMYENINPVFIMQNDEQYFTLNAKINVDDISNTMAQMEEAWTTVYPNEPFGIVFMDESIRQFYDREQRLSEVITWFTVIALFIGGIGLFGLITYVVNQRQKEIGVRKVMGASFKDLIYVISRDFVILLCIAFVISAPLSWYFGNQWLEDYLFRIDIAPTIFVFAFTASLAVALVSIAQKCWQATRVNPVETLRNE